MKEDLGYQGDFVRFQMLFYGVEEFWMRGFADHQLFDESEGVRQSERAGQELNRLGRSGSPALPAPHQRN